MDEKSSPINDIVSKGSKCLKVFPLQLLGKTSIFYKLFYTIHMIIILKSLKIDGMARLLDDICTRHWLSFGWMLLMKFLINIL